MRNIDYLRIFLHTTIYDIVDSYMLTIEQLDIFHIFFKRYRSRDYALPANNFVFKMAPFARATSQCTSRHVLVKSNGNAKNTKNNAQVFLSFTIATIIQ